MLFCTNYLSRETKVLPCVMKGECADRVMELYKALSREGQVLVVLQYARVVENPTGLCFY